MQSHGEASTSLGGLGIAALQPVAEQHNQSPQRWGQGQGQGMLPPLTAGAGAVSFIGNPQRLADLSGTAFTGSSGSGGKSARLNPALAGRRGDGPAPPAGAVGRAAVSLPTSPVMRSMSWQPLSADLPQLTAVASTSHQAATATLSGALDPFVSPSSGATSGYHSPVDTHTVHTVNPNDIAMQPKQGWNSHPSSADPSRPPSPSAGRHDSSSAFAPDPPRDQEFVQRQQTQLWQHRQDSTPHLDAYLPIEQRAHVERFGSTGMGGQRLSQTALPGSAGPYDQPPHVHQHAEMYRPSFAPSSSGATQSGSGGQGQRRGSDMDMDMDMDQDMGASMDSGDRHVRKKRQQVRVACTHCQKACKKCSNTRPCERCVKYGFKDCIDSSRKPRKTGVKRGPYKRRLSKFANTPPPDFMNQPVFGRFAHYDTPSAARRPSYQQYFPSGSSNPGSSFQLPALTGLNAHGELQRPPQTATAAGSGQTRQPRAAPQALGGGGGLESALAALQSSATPRWVNGQRVSVDHTNMPPDDLSGSQGSRDVTGDGGVPFPLSAGLGRSRPRTTDRPPFGLANPSRSGGLGLSLGGGMGYDPFSRAVSPIRETPTTARPRIDIDRPLTSQLPSQYTSPVSAEPDTVTRDVFGPKLNTNAPLPGIDAGPMKTLRRIHRPNLRTLISPGISREPSPVDLERDPGAPAPARVEDLAAPMLSGTPISSNTSGLPTFFAEQISPAEASFGHRPFSQAEGMLPVLPELLGLRPHVREQMQRRSGAESPVLFNGSAEDGASYELPF